MYELVHGSQLLEALRVLGCAPEEISHVIATHGHKEYVGAYRLFPAAFKQIHPADHTRCAPKPHGVLLVSRPLRRTDSGESKEIVLSRRR